MFIYLDNSLLVSNDNSEALEIAKAVRNLVIATSESKHILYGDMNIIAALRERMRGDRDMYNVLNRIYQKYAQLACPQEITYYIKVAKEDGGLEQDENGKAFAKVSYKKFTDSENAQACNLVSEDYNDCDFYRIVLEHYKKVNDCKISCRFNDCSGSGDRTERNLKKCLYERKQITLCIVDSDRKYRGQEIAEGSTCGKCAKIGRRIATYQFLQLDVQEIENLVPFNVIDNLTWTAESKDNKDAFDNLRYKAQTEDVLPYFDIKGGLVKNELFANDVKYRDYVKTCYYMNPQLAAHGDFETYVDGLPNDTVIYPHLRKGLLKNFLEYRKEHPLCDMDLLEYQLAAWNLIGQLMLNMGCCRNSEAIVG
jgi:hypothetical protein